jgi:hypothetical protein
MEKFIEYNASLLYTYIFVYLSLYNSERDISTAAQTLICIIVILNLNRWNIRLKVFVEDKVFSLFWLQKQISRSQRLWTLIH